MTDKPITTGELIFAVMKCREFAQVMTNEIAEAIRARLTDYDALKDEHSALCEGYSKVIAQQVLMAGEIVALRAEVSHAKSVAEGAGYRLANAEADVSEWKDWERVCNEQATLLKRAEAELAAARPLIEAGKTLEPYLSWIEETSSGYKDAEKAVRRLRLAYRAAGGVK